MMLASKILYSIDIVGDDQLAIIYHPDADGVCSAALFAKFLNDINAEFFLLNQKEEISITPATVRVLREKGIKYAVILDMNVDSNPSSYLELESIMNKILIMDHHVLKKDLSSSKTMHLNVSMVDDNPASYPTSKFVYDALSGIHERVESYSWIPAIGIIGDSSKKRWKHFLTEVCDTHGIELELMEEAAISIELCKALSYEKLELCLNGMIRAESIADFLDSLPGEIKKLKEEFYAELNRALESKEVHDQIVFVELKSEHNFKSLVANALSFEHFPNKTVVVMWLHGDKIHVSLRRQDGKLSMDLLIRNVVKLLKAGDGGGHAPAAGAKFPSSVGVERLKEALIISHRELIKAKLS